MTERPIKCLSCGSLKVSGLYRIITWADAMWWNELHQNFTFANRDPGMDADILPEELERFCCRDCGEEWTVEIERLRQNAYIAEQEE